MISKQKIFFLIIVLILIWGIINFSGLIPENNNYQIYSNGLNKYQNNSYSDAYYLFGKVSRFSKLKSAAIYRQALCANKLGDNKTEIKKYKEVINHYPNTNIGIRAKYLQAQYFYEDKKYNKAQKEFNEILHKYPKSDYGIAAQYYLGSIAIERAEKTQSKKKKIKLENKAVKYFKGYLKITQNGRFSINCAEKWIKLNTKLNNEDNLLIVKTYLANNDYKTAFKYLKLTNLSASWPYFVKDAYMLKDYQKVKYYTISGLKNKTSNEILINEGSNEQEENKNIYDSIDIYLKVSNSPKESLSYLLSIAQKAKGYDYLLFKNCNNLPNNSQTACFNTLYYKYPNGQFSAEALANIFYDKIKSQKYFMARELGRKHLSKYPYAKSTPMVMFWMAKIAQRTKNYEEAKIYYTRVINQFPDDYYAYHSFLNLNRLRRFDIIDLKQKPIEFPYKNYDCTLVTELAKVKDYGLINQLYKDDEFIQSWLAHLQGNFASSARIARDAMEKLTVKPDKSDLRWRLVYPIHYYDEITQKADYWINDPILILSIIREESYFNPKAKSSAGARGLMQLMPPTAFEAANTTGINISNPDELFNPDININLGNIYYSQLKRKLSNKDILAVLAYNGGIGAVAKWQDNLNYWDTDDFIEQVPYSETKNYLKKVYRTYWNYIRIYDGIRF